MSAGDLVATLSLDISDFMSPLDAASNAADSHCSQIDVVIKQNEESWKSMAAVAAASAAGTVAATAAMSAASVAANAAMSAGGFAAAHSKEIITTGLLGAALYKYGGIVNTVAKMTIPQYAAIGTAVGVAFTAYKIGTNEAVQNAIKATYSQLKLSESVGTVSASFWRLGSAIAKPFQEGGAAVLDYLNNFNPIPSILEIVGKNIQFVADATASFVDKASEGFTYYADSAVAAALAVTSASGISAHAYFEEGQRLRELAEESAKLIAIQEGQRNAYQSLRSIQEDALAAGVRAEELASVATLKTKEAVEAKWNALQQLNAELIRNGQATAGATAHAKAMFEALARQKEGIASGRLSEKAEKPAAEKSNPIDAIIASAQQQLLVLKEGETEAAIASAKAKGATDEQVASLRALLEEKNAINSANQVQKQFEQQIAEAQKEANRIQDQGIKKIEDLRDKIDEASGAASKYEILQRQLERQGFAEDQIKEMVELQEQFDKLNEKEKEAKPDADKKSKTGSNRFAGLGSQEAAKILLSGVGENKLEDLSKGQLLVQKQMLAVFNSTNGILNTMANKEGSDIGG